MKKVNVADVKLWGNIIGAISWDEDQQVGTFEYDPQFLEAHGIEPSPIMMEKRLGTFSFPAESKETFKGLPGMLADSLPDKFGNALIESWLAHKGRTAADFSPVERLCYLGDRGMGALEYSPALETGKLGEDVEIVIQDMVELASQILQDRKNVKLTMDPNDEDNNKEAMKTLLRIGSSPGGARAKCLIAYNEKTKEVRSGQVQCAKGFQHYLLKLDGVKDNKDKELNDPMGYGRAEFAYYKMATDCQIEMMDCQLLEENGRAHFITKRFDRVGGGKLHMQSLCGLMHLDFNQAGAHSYEQALQLIRQIVKKETQKTLEQQVRRTFFNIIARNQDDHTKNIAFLMNQKGHWSLSPAFDMAYSYNPTGQWTKSHQMTVNGKRDHFEREDLLAFAEKADLSNKVAQNMINEITQVVSNWESYFKKAKVPKKIVEGVRGNLRLDLSLTD